MAAQALTHDVTWEADVLLADGGVVRLRPVRAGDASDEAAIRAMYGRLSEETIRLRFFGALHRRLEKDLAMIMASDQRDRVVLLAVLGDDVIGLGYFTRSPQDSSEAEIAFLIEDAHHKRGVGSIILEHLAAAGRERGLDRFTAEVLPDNTTMISVFREVGFEVGARTEDGVVLVTLRIAPTNRSLEVMRAREHTAEARSVARLLAPRSVAVIGASRSPRTLGHAIFRHLLAAPFQGPVFPVNAAADHVAGVHAYRDIADVPEGVDVAFVVVPAEDIPALIPRCAAKGVHSLVIVSSFADLDPGHKGSVVALARAHGMRVVGPECMGIFNTDPAVQLNGSLVPELPPAGRVGFFAQSGSLGVDVLDRALHRGVGVSTLVSAGERADVSGNSLLQYWLDDDATDLVLLYLETFGNPQKFARLARAVSRRKPVVAVQAVAPEDLVRAQAMFAQSGIIRVDSLGELLDVATLLGHGRLPRGNRVAILDNITSLGRIAEASCPVHGLVVAGGGATHLGARATLEELGQALTAALANDEVDAVVTAFAAPLGDPSEAGAVIERIAAASDKPVLVTSPQQFSSWLPTYTAPEEAVRAMAHAARYVAWRALPPGRVPFFENVDVQAAAGALAHVQAAGGQRLGEAAAQVLACYGLPLGDGPGREGDGGGVTVTIRVTDDAVFGRAISLGLAGVTSELLGDRSWRALPMTDADAGRMIDDLRASPLLTGYGGGEPADRAALVDVLMRVARIGTDHPVLRELVVEAVCGAAGVRVLDARGVVAKGAVLDDQGPRRLT
ncbi:GNAT family N-acetyltransferase [Janibacter sp. G1551]|uniref:bifunctional acetate--CoA ligase family protein/GNAT family N-acetyltransferase n=1 Tax=Janibacter sp. G1551 TaxID=3420440 RepID=UPI003D0791F6